MGWREWYLRDGTGDARAATAEREAEVDRGAGHCPEDQRDGLVFFIINNILFLQEVIGVEGRYGRTGK